MALSKAPDDDWITQHRTAWAEKPGLRHYYQGQIFDRVVAELEVGPTLQLGAGPGFFSNYHPGMTNTDVVAADGIDMLADAHDLPYPDSSFSNVVGIDVLHHFARPGRAIAECGRVLKPGGRLVFVEPWSGGLGGLFWRYFHHEACRPVEDPWRAAGTDEHDPMDGNAAIPRGLLSEHPEGLSATAPELALATIQHFGGLAYLLTGGFQSWGMPAPFIRTLAAIENTMPTAMKPYFFTRALFVLKKAEDAA